MDFVENGSLLYVSDLEKKKKNLSPTETFALEEAKDFQATAVYFRQFQDGRSPIPQIYLYDNTKGEFDNKRTAEIHRDLWSYCRIPMFIIIEKTDVKIFDARQSVKPLNKKFEGELFREEIFSTPIETNPIDNLKISSEAVKHYSRKLFDSGIFWESEKARDKFSESTSAYRDLIVNLKKIRKDFIKKTSLPEKTANKLLVFSILIKYLEERGNENKSSFAHDFFRELGSEKFVDILRQTGKIVALFDELSRHFNGRIFEWDDNEKQLLYEEDLSELANFLDGDSNLETRQRFLDWRKYSFNHLPVELISSVYEEFLNERKDAVYTPEFLVTTLIDESMPQDEFEKLSVKTIDVSCGSGIFLVSAFKRLAQRHRYAEFKKTGELKTLKSDELLKIIKENIFGVDIEEEAIRLTVFSLCLALCDQLKPREIWKELQFDETFQDNFKSQNFFDYLETEKGKLKTFDLVIGNAPFVELNIEKDNGDIYYFFDKDENKVNLNLELSKKLNGKKNIFPRNQLALMFLDQSPKLLKEGGLLCLIMPASPLLYNNTAEFRKDFFPRHQVYQLLDFTSLESILFGTAKVPAVAIFVNKQNFDKEQTIAHITIRRTISVEEKIFFEIDKYDFHYVSQYEALNSKHIWKSNLLGGGRLSNMIERFSGIDSIGDYLKNKKKENWVSGEGYIVGTPQSKDRKKADFINLKPSLPSDALDENGIDKSQIFTETEEFFYRRSRKEIFEPPTLLIREIIGTKKIPVYLSTDYLTFKHSVFGISSPKADEQSLHKLYESFEKNKEIHRLLITVSSNRYLVGKATSILKQDITSLPYSEDKREMQLSYIERIICDDVLKYQIETLSKGSSAEANWKKASKNDLEKFGEVFSKGLNSVYGEPNKSFYLMKIYDLGAFYITEFKYGENSEKVGEPEKINELTEHIESLVETKYRPNVFLIKILKLYETNKIYLIKPKTLRYWLRSIAIKDADEAFADLVDAGY